MIEQQPEMASVRDIPDPEQSPVATNVRPSGLQFSPYRVFSRADWARLRADTPMTLVQRDLETLSGIIEELSLEEVEQIYLPMSRLLNLYVAAAQELHRASANFLGHRDGKVPFIIGCAGRSRSARARRPAF